VIAALKKKQQYRKDGNTQNDSAITFKKTQRLFEI
jgi:hypothetical protein